MTQKLHITVEWESPPIRIDKYIAQRINLLSRQRIQQLIENHHVILNQKIVIKTKEKVQPGDEITISLPPPEPSQVEPEEIDFEILYEDEAILLVNKPAGLSVHPTEHQKTGTLVNGLLLRIKNLSGVGGVLRPGIVHRLDKVTSGILIVTKTDESHRHISNQFKERKIEKVYWAIVHGTVTKKQGEVDLPIGRHKTDRKRMTTRSDGRPSVTQYRILHTGLGGSLVEVYPKTGRTHQIRVHLRHLGIPVVHDLLYSLKKYAHRGTLEQQFKGYPGIALHAKRLRFEHPVSGQEMEFEAPLPQRFQAVVDQLLCPKSKHAY